MTEGRGSARRVRVERGIYRRSTGVLEVGFKDETGRQRWRTVEGGILAARKVRDDLAALRRGGRLLARRSGCGPAGDDAGQVPFVSCERRA